MRVESLVGGAAVGASFGRTALLVRWFRQNADVKGDSSSATTAAIVGGIVGFAVVFVAVLLGGSLPEWMEVPVTVVAVQGGFALTMGRLLTSQHGPLSTSPTGPTYEQVAFTLFGAITMPGLAIFIVTMTLVDVL